MDEADRMILNADERWYDGKVGEDDFSEVAFAMREKRGDGHWQSRNCPMHPESVVKIRAYLLEPATGPFLCGYCGGELWPQDAVTGIKYFTRECSEERPMHPACVGLAALALTNAATPP